MLKTLQADDDRSADQSQVNVGGSVWKQRHNHNNPVHQWFSNHGTRTILIWFELMFIFNRNLCLPSAIVFQPVTPETRFAPLLYHRHYSAVASLRPVSLCFTFSSLPNPPLKFVLHSSHSLGGPLVSQTHTETNTSMCVCGLMFVSLWTLWFCPCHCFLLWFFWCQSVVQCQSPGPGWDPWEEPSVRRVAHHCEGPSKTERWP